MSKIPKNKVIASAAALTTCTAYAVLLSTKRGSVFERDDSSRWLVTAVGVGIIGAINTAAGHSFPWRLFVLGGLPFAVRAVWRGVVRHEESIARAFDG